MKRRRLGLMLIAGLLGTTAGCKPKARPDQPDRGATILPIVVRTNEDSNAGRPVYVIIRAIDEKRFIEDSYVDVAALVIEPDDTVLATILAFPGGVVYRELELSEVPEVIGVYCLFTKVDDGAWKVMLDKVAAVEVIVDVSAITAEEPAL